MAFNCFELMTHPAERQEYAASLSFEILYRSLLFRNCKIGCLSSYHATEKLHDVSRAVEMEAVLTWRSRGPIALRGAGQRRY